jgi:hypothetical protein
MAHAIQFTLTPEQMTHFLAWRAQVETATGQPVEGVLFSLLVTRNGLRQILVRPSTDEDFKLKHIARTDGTYDVFAPYEEVLAEYDNFGFADAPLDWPEVGIRLHICYGPLLERGETPRCYVEWLEEPHRPFIPFRISDQPAVLEDDDLCTVFPSTPLPPAVYQRVCDFLRINAALLLQYWQGEIGIGAFDALQWPGGGAETTGGPA